MKGPSERAQRGSKEGIVRCSDESKSESSFEKREKSHEC